MAINAIVNASADLAIQNKCGSLIEDVCRLMIIVTSMAWNGIYLGSMVNP